MSEEKVILVDKNDNQVGLMPKLEAHEKGVLHRAFSIFIFNSKYELLLQKRASSKYHSGGLWTNTCCSHPREGEDILDAANRRLDEEMGIKTSLRKVYDFIYKAELDNQLTEHEFDHVFYGVFDNDPILNEDEAEDFDVKEIWPFDFFGTCETPFDDEDQPDWATFLGEFEGREYYIAGLDLN